MSKLQYSHDELLAEHDYHRLHLEDGKHFHGGFDAQGRYVSPRTLHRWPAIRNWQASLAERGLPLLDASRDLLKRGNYPNYRQQVLLIENGMGQTFWNSLTITGIIEARGQALVDFPAPVMQEIIDDDVSDTAVGHLGKGLLVAHGMDEGGDPSHPDVGAHDAMWFEARDLLFGAGAFPVPEPPSSIERPREGRYFPGMPDAHEGLLALLLDVLMIEVRAEAFFDFSMKLARSDAFGERGERAARAAVLIERIQQDEAVHVGYLQTVISELRGVSFKGGVKGAEMIDPVWEKMVRWHGADQFDLVREQMREDLRERILSAPRGGMLFEKFEALGKAA